MSIGIGGSPSVILGIPAGEGVARFSVAVGGQAGCLIIGHGLIRCAAAVGGVAIEFDGIMVGAPLGVQGNGFPIDRCQITDILSVGIGGSTAIGLGIPARKGIARLGITVNGQAGCLIIRHGLIRCAAAVGSVAIEFD